MRAIGLYLFKIKHFESPCGECRTKSVPSIIKSFQYYDLLVQYYCNRNIIHYCFISVAGTARLVKD